MKTQKELEQHSKRMLELLDFLRMTQSQLARALNKSSVEPVRRVVIKRLPITKALANTIIEKFPQISYSWLINGELGGVITKILPPERPFPR